MKKLKKDNQTILDIFLSSGMLLDRISKIQALKKQLKKQFPIKGNLLILTDKILGKRKIQWKRKY